MRDSSCSRGSNPTKSARRFRFIAQLATCAHLHLLCLRAHRYARSSVTFQKGNVAVPVYNPKRFVDPDALRRVPPGALLELLEPHKTFFEHRGLRLPSKRDAATR